MPARNTSTNTFNITSIREIHIHVHERQVPDVVEKLKENGMKAQVKIPKEKEIGTGDCAEQGFTDDYCHDPKNLLNKGVMFGV
jgi:hypothetical protein